MKNLIFSNDNSIEPAGTVGIQKVGIIFWQKTGFLRYCNEIGFHAMVELVKKRFSPTSIQLYKTSCYFQFDNHTEKIIFLSLKKKSDSNHCFLYGESSTVYVDADFHILTLNVVSYIGKQIGSKFFVDDATEYLRHHSMENLEQYIKEFQANQKY